MIAHSKSGDLAKAVEMFDRIIANSDKPNLIIYNTIINVHAKGGNVFKSEEMFDRMIGEGVKSI
jgi:pentatricopeptide repeat protein